MWLENAFLQNGKYRVIRQIGSGGFGLTYLAEDIFLRRTLVIKSPNQKFEFDQDYEKFVRRFQREGQALSGFSHPNIVRVYEYFEEDGMPCLAIAYIEGDTLNEQVRKKGAVPQDFAVQYFRKISSALKLLHEKGLIHCDLHPGNIIIQPDNEPVLIDFGSAKLLQPATFTVTTTVNTSFAPYEQGIQNEPGVEKQEIQPTIDIYGLAATLYFAVTAQRPMSSMSRKLYGDKLKPPKEIDDEIENWLNEAILRGIELEAKDRPQSIYDWEKLLYPPKTKSLSTPVVKSPKRIPPQPATIQPSRPPAPEPSKMPGATVQEHKFWRSPAGLGALGLLGVCGVFSIIWLGNTSDSDSNGPDLSTRGKESLLTTIINRGNLICGVDGGIPGFSFVDETGTYSGLDVDICKAVAAALFNDPDAVEYRRLDSTERFTALAGGEVDMVSRNTAWTLSRDTLVGMEFGPTTFYDGQGMMVRKASGISSLTDFAGKAICVEYQTTTEFNLTNQMRKLGVEFEPVVFQDVDAAFAAYDEERCEGITTDKSLLLLRRSILESPDEHMLLEVTMSKEPLGPLTLNNDSAWFDVVKWVTYGLIQAEEFGITSDNIDEFTGSDDYDIPRFLGEEGTLGEDMGLPNDFMYRVISNVGNYGEIYERNFGAETQFNLERGQNALWTEGGLMYSPPWR